MKFYILFSPGRTRQPLRCKASFILYQIILFKFVDFMIINSHLAVLKRRPDADKQPVPPQVNAGSLLHIFYTGCSVAADAFPSVPHCGSSKRECAGHAQGKYPPVSPASI